MNKFLPSTLAFGLILVPLASFAGEATQPPTDLKSLIRLFTDLVNPIIGLLVGLAVMFFMWGIVKYISSAGDEKKKVSGKDTMGYGLLAIFVLFSFWGIVRFFYQSIFE